MWQRQKETDTPKTRMGMFMQSQHLKLGMFMQSQHLKLGVLSQRQRLAPVICQRGFGATARAHDIYTTYDGTPASLAGSSPDAGGNDSLDLGLETVELVYDKHSPPPHYPPPLEKVPPIVFLHGLFGSKSNNRSVSKQLAKKLNCDVYCVDLRNHGDSPHHARHDYPAMAADVERFIAEKLGADSVPIVMGHSMGAKCAMAVALRRPRLLAGLVAVDNAPVDFTAGGTGYSKFGKYVRQLQQIEASAGVRSLKDCDGLLAHVESSLPIRQFLLTNMRRGDDGHYRSRVPLDIMSRSLDNISAWPFSSSVSRWGGPSLFVRGTQSAYVVDEYLEAIGRFFPNFSTVDIDAGHWLISEKPAEFVATVDRWVLSREWD